MENNIKNNEAKKGKFNIVDAFAIILVLAVLFVVFYLVDPFSIFKPDGRQDVTIRYVLEFKGIDNDVVDIDNFTKGEAVVGASSNNAMGKIVDVKVEESFVWEASEDGTTMVKKTLANKSDIYITVEVGATFKKGEGYLVNGVQIAHGTQLDLRFENFMGSGKCIELVKVK